MDDFLREIQEDIERQKWAHLWERHGKHFMYLVGAIVLLAGGWQGMKYMDRQANMKQTDQLLTAIKASDVDAFKAAATSADGVHQGFATLIEAQLLESQGKSEESNAVLAALAKKSDGSMPYDLARALTPSSTNTGDIFQFTALERMGWQALESKDYGAARKAFEAILQGEEVPGSIVDRAKAGLAYLATQSDEG